LLAIVDVDGSPVIQFSHFSVKEYLTSRRLLEEKGTISRFHVSMTRAHTIVAQACLGVLLHLNENVTKDDLKHFPLVDYAARYWADHARFEGVWLNIKDGAKRLFDPNNRYLSVWVWIYDPERGRRDDSLQYSSQARATALHYATFCDLNEIVKFLIVEHSQDVNSLGFADETPLGVASRKGYHEIARVLLEHGANTEVRDRRDWSPLEQGLAQGSVETIRVLLDHSADVKALDLHRRTPLRFASYFGRLAAAQMLLEHGADPNAKVSIKSPLHLASNESIVLVLSEYNADMNVQDNANWTPLHEALDHGREEAEVACMLVKNGADPNARNDKGLTPLHMASGGGYLDVVRLLLQKSSDIHARDNDDRTPFQYASMEEHHEVMQLLLEHGAEDHEKR
jgi:ankyrin repeat protein